LGFSSSEEDSEDSSLLAAAFLTTTGAAFALRIHTYQISGKLQVKKYRTLPFTAGFGAGASDSEDESESSAAAFFCLQCQCSYQRMRRDMRRTGTTAGAAFFTAGVSSSESDDSDEDSAFLTGVFLDFLSEPLTTFSAFFLISFTGAATAFAALAGFESIYEVTISESTMDEGTRTVDYLCCFLVSLDFCFLVGTHF